jgi:hypothetical protein
MKKLILALFVGLFYSCTPEYIAKDKNGNPILIRDRAGVIEDAKVLGIDSITVMRFDNDAEFHPLRQVHADETVFRSDTLSNGKKIAWSMQYRNVKLANVIER